MPADMGTESQIAFNLRKVQENIQNACGRAGRNPEEVTLIAVSKTKPFSSVADAHEAGARDFGENYVQELTQKCRMWDSLCPDRGIRWHMIGHLQKNKVKYLIGTVVLIHSVDSVSLAEQIEREAAKRNTAVKILMEVNAAEEKTKWGFSLREAPDAARQISALPHVRLLGLMTSAPYTDDPETNRVHFRAMRSLAAELAEHELIAEDPEIWTPVLSMGMSGDYEVAVEEGATMVRVGSSIFGERDYTAKQKE